MKLAGLHFRTAWTEWVGCKRSCNPRIFIGNQTDNPFNTSETVIKLFTFQWQPLSSTQQARCIYIYILGLGFGVWGLYISLPSKHFHLITEFKQQTIEQWNVPGFHWRRKQAQPQFSHPWLSEENLACTIGIGMQIRCITNAGKLIHNSHVGFLCLKQMNIKQGNSSSENFIITFERLMLGQTFLYRFLR